MVEFFMAKMFGANYLWEMFGRKLQWKSLEKMPQLILLNPVLLKIQYTLGLGPRLGRFDNGKLVPFANSSIPLATLGVFILWLGWFGFNGGSQLALGTGADAIAVSKIFINTAFNIYHFLNFRIQI